ncbi:MAG: phosphohydrolase [Chloroflexi bacterium]|nr:MAG: phosphohydrolase [Chloroflexota bacterium]
MKCFYHNDADGKCAAFWVHHTEQARDQFEPYYKISDYGQEFPHDLVQPGEMVWIVDFSIEPDDMFKLIEKCGLDKIHWIDHHKTAIDKYKDFPHEIQGIRDNDKAACELTFEYVSWWVAKTMGSPGSFEEYRVHITAPMFTQLIADRDIWRWQYGQVTKFFYAGSQLLDLRPFSVEWTKLLYEPKYCEEIQKNGELIEQFRARQRRIDINYFGCKVEFEGIQCMAINGSPSGDLGQDICDMGYEVGIVYRRSNNGKWAVNLYSATVDVGEIARAFGGGGHKGAAGFKVDSDPNSLWMIEGPFRP